MEKFELHIADTDVSSGSISVGWCVPKEVLARLNELKINDPQVVIVVSPEENYHIKKEYRKVVPLKDLIGYVDFRVSGKNRIWGFISQLSPRETKNRFLTKDEGEYRSTTLEYYGKDWSFSSKDNGFYSDPVKVYVPAECFAPEPSQREKAWVNWLHRDKCVDQCEFRRRRLFAYTVQPLLFAMLYTAILLTTLGALLYGSRKFNLDLLKHPLAASPYNLLEMFEDGSIFISKEEAGFKKYLKLPLMPLFLIGSAVVVWACLHFVLMRVVIAVFSLSSLILWAVRYLVERQVKSAIAEEFADMWYTKEEEAQLMVCSPGKRLTKLSDLPKEKRTVKLRFLALKSKVCRPFSL